MRMLCAVALALSLGLWVAFAGGTKPADPKEARAAKLADLKKRYEEVQKELAERFARADDDGRRGIESEMREEALLFAGKMIKIAEDDPKDDVGFEAAAFIVRTAGKVRAEGPDVTKAAEFIAEHHINNAQVKDLLAPAMRTGPSGAKLLKAAAEKSTDKGTKATALFIRGYQLAQTVENEEDEKKVPGLIRAATDLLEEAAKAAPGTKIGDTTIEKSVQVQLKDLKAVGALLVGRAAPDAASKTLDDKKATLADYKGKVVLLDVWATWCGPCRRMIPHERALAQKLKDKPFAIISVSADKDKKTLQDFLKKEDMPWVHWWDNGPEGELLKTYRVGAFPTLYLIDHEGIIRQRWLFGFGESGDEKKLDDTIDELLKIAAKSKG